MKRECLVTIKPLYNSGLTQVALQGIRKQSVEDAEKLLSKRVASFMMSKGFAKEAEYVSIVADWHRANDERGVNQISRCKANYSMLNYILDEWMPWHKETYDFSTIDINRLV